MIHSIAKMLKRVDAQKVIAIVTIFITLYFFGVSRFISSAFFSELQSGGGYGTTDTTAPSVTYKQVVNIGTGSVTVQYGFTDDTYTSTAGGTGHVTLTPYAGGTGSTADVTVSFGSPNVANANFNGLTAATRYSYTIVVADNYGNSSTTNGNFYTASNPITLGGGTVTTTGSTSLTGNTVSNGGSVSLSGTTVTVSDDGSSTDSITGSLTITGAVTIVVSGSSWNGVILPPTQIAGGSSQAATTGELASLLPTVGSNSSNIVLGTIKAGAEGTTLLASGGNFTISFYAQGASAGDVIYLYRSTDGNTWELNSPDRTCTVSSSLMCTFQTNHLTYFASSKIQTSTTSTSGGGYIPTLVTSSSSSGGGGSSSYVSTTTNTTTTNNEDSTTTTTTSSDTNEDIQTLEDSISTVQEEQQTTSKTYKINGTEVEIDIPTFKSSKTQKTVELLNAKIVDLIAEKDLDADKLQEAITAYNKFLSALQIYKDEGNQDAKTLAKIYAKQMLAAMGAISSTSASTSTSTYTSYSSQSDVATPASSSSAEMVSNSDLPKAITFGYENGLTTYYDAASFRANDYITRQEAAKFFTEFSQKVMGNTVDTSKDCNFTDVANADSTLKKYITLSCQLGIFKGTPEHEFKPFDNMTKGQALAVVVRTGAGILDESTNPWYLNYYNQALSLGIIDSGVAVSTYEANAKRGEVITLMYNYAKALGKTE